MPRPVRPPAGWSYDVEVGGVVIGTPCYGGVTHASFTGALSETRQELSTRGIPHAWIYLSTESFIPRGRNRITAEFLARPQATHLIFIDADIEWQPLDVIRLLSHGVDVVAGVYPKKCEKPLTAWSVPELQAHIDWFKAHKRALLKGRPPPDQAKAPPRPAEWPLHALINRQGISPYDERTGRIGVTSLPTGFLCLQRRVFEQMAAAGVVEKIEEMEGVEGAVLANLYNFWWSGVEDGIHWSEDYGFCRKWRQTGGELWLDPAIKLIHHGVKAFDGDPATIYAEPEQPIRNLEDVA